MNSTLNVVPATNRPDVNSTLVASCLNCGKSESIDVPTSSIEVWDNGRGAFVQDAFPMLTAEQREFFFLSGLCATCWDDLFLGVED